MRSRWRVIGVVLLAASLAGAFSTSLSYRLAIEQAAMMAASTPPRQVPPPNIGYLAILNLSFWYGWALLAVPLMLLARQIRIDQRPQIAVPIHVGAVLVASIVHVAIQTSAQVYVSWQRALAANRLEILDAGWVAMWKEIFTPQLTQLIDWELVAGAAIVGIAHAIFYYRESQRRALETAQLETKLVAAQLQALQSQLHPHFLFNTLHAISALMHRDVQAADRMLVQLSDLLRMTLASVTHPEIRLNEEMDFLEKYLHIEQVRLGERLTVKFDVDVEVLDAVVPALILQPLVENAIKHGIAPHGRSGRVSVAAHREGDMLIMTVADTGPGPSERTMSALSTGIGVANTRARLLHQFGTRYRFEFHRKVGEFVVLVAVPLRQEQQIAVA